MLQICQSCGREAPTRYVAFYQNIGALVVRFHKSVEGHLCKSCVHHYFWSFSALTFFFGWWGTISFIVTPFFLLNNVVRYLICLPMPAPSDDASRPELTDEALQRLEPHTDELLGRLQTSTNFEEVFEDIANQAGVTPGQVHLYCNALVAAHRRQQGR